MIPNQMLLVPRILFHALIVLNALEDDLAKAVKVCDIGHLWVEELAHQ